MHAFAVAGAPVFSRDVKLLLDHPRSGAEVENVEIETVNKGLDTRGARDGKRSRQPPIPTGRFEERRRPPVSQAVE